MIAKRARFRAIDVVIILLCIAAGVFIYYRIEYGLEYKGDWSAVPQYLLRRNEETGRLVPNFLLQGLITTLKLSVWATILATIVGIIVGLFRTGDNLFLRMVGRTYVELIRNLPPLVLIFIFYFFAVDQIMPLLGVEEFIRNRSEGAQAILAIFFAQKSLFVQFISGIVTLAFFEGAYITEVVRAGIESVERGQTEAAYSLGLSWPDQMRFIVMPQAIKRVLPALANEFINTVKYSSIASIVSIQELTFMGRQVVVATRYIFETWITVSAMYMVLTLSLSLVAGQLERKMRQSD
ncbi:MAG: amino acid ABC transporter permease [Chloroflexi bacterium]|nr:MAG: amino acid ABC transporter permease [Chloroflexota bacterium]RLC86310.1 MAG: amino acid ABC transporter permease [Chloroflexota bacterium]